MFLIVTAEKGSYDSCIEISKEKGYAKNRKEAEDIFIELLVDEFLSRVNDDDMISLGIDFDNPKEKTREYILECIKRMDKKIHYNGDYDYICLSYNKQKNITSYTIPCFSDNEYMGKTVSILSCMY